MFWFQRAGKEGKKKSKLRARRLSTEFYVIRVKMTVTDVYIYTMSRWNTTTTFDVIVISNGHEKQQPFSLDYGKRKSDCAKNMLKHSII